jgi:hypothetical protein
MRFKPAISSQVNDSPLCQELIFITVDWMDLGRVVAAAFRLKRHKRRKSSP